MKEPAAVERPKTQHEWSTLLAQRIEESDLSARRFATDVLLRNEGVIRRWLALDSPIPGEVQDFLVEPMRAPWP